MADSKPILVTQQDFDLFKKEIKREIKDELEKMRSSLFFQLSSVIVLCVGIAFIAFAYINDYRLDFTNEKNQEDFAEVKNNVAELRSVVFTPSNETILREIRDLKTELASFHIKQGGKKKVIFNRKINNVSDRMPASIDLPEEQ